MTGRHVSRRQFVLRGMSAVGAAALATRATPAAAATALPSPSRSGLDHIVVLTMENRSFDHLIGWAPGADGKQAGLTYTDRNGVAHSTWPLAPDFQGCGYSDPDHGYLDSRTAYDNGRCDGWLRTGKNDVYSIGYYRQQDLPFLGAAVPAWTVCDGWFAPIMGPTMANRMYLHAGRTDRIDDLPLPSVLRTIWDGLLAKRISARYYRTSFSYLALWGTKYARITHTLADFLHDCRTGGLPSVAYVDPTYTLPVFGLGNDDHPPSDVRAGEWLMNAVYRAVTTGPAWPRTLLMIVFDEWGGFFEHVPPSRAPDANPLHSLRGFRVPALLISPFARRAHVDHTVFDHASVLKLIEWRFGLAPLSARDKYAANPAVALDFSHRRLSAPAFSVPRVTTSKRCP